MTAVEERFQQLAAQWREETLFESSATKLCTHPAYVAIVKLGSVVVPLILGELSQKPDHWDTALRAITGADPVDLRDWGNLERMTQAWLRWGMEQGYVT